MFKNREIRLHSWGGLGSQLFALGTAHQVHQRIPHRKIALVIHSSGVTARQPELNFRNEWLRIEFVDDFRDSILKVKKTSASLQSKFRRIPLGLIKTMCFLNNLNTDSELRKLKTWVISIRGHYTHKNMDVDSLEFLSKVLDLDVSGRTQNDAIGLHYRLGDLLTLDSKSIISEASLIEQVKYIRVVHGINQINVFTDSPDAAKILLEPIEGDLKVLNIDTLATIQTLIGHKIFVGTNSKISIWITLFRLNSNPNSVIYLPEKSRQELSRILVNLPSWENLYFFGPSDK